ncbi:hypothetical protein FF1_035236 [Malus domestica]
MGRRALAAVGMLATTNTTTKAVGILGILGTRVLLFSDVVEERKELCHLEFTPFLQHFLKGQENRLNSHPTEQNEYEKKREALCNSPAGRASGLALMMNENTEVHHFSKL